MPRQVLGNFITLVGLSSGFPEIAKAIIFKKVVLSRSLQTNNQHNHPVIPCTTLLASTLTDMCLGNSGDQIVNESTNVAAHAGLKPCTTVQV